MVEDIEIYFASCDKTMFLLSSGQISLSRMYGFIPNECVKEWHPLSRAKIGPIIRHTSEAVKARN